MKVLYLTPGCFDKGGISRYCRYQIRALRDVFGNENVRTISLLGPDKDSFEEPFDVYYSGHGISRFEKIKFILVTLWNVITWRPQVIHTAHINMGGMAKWMARLCGAKTILNGYGFEVWSPMRNDAKYGMKHSDVFMTDCHYTAQYLEDEKIRPEGSVVVIWDCVDLDRFKPGERDKAIINRYNIPDPEKYILIMSLGRLAKVAAHKGFDRLIKVFARVAAKHENARLVIAGKGDGRPAYEALAEELGIADKVCFTGMVDEADLPGIYRLASIFSLVSDRGEDRGEGIPLTPLEAMATGAAIIVGNHDGSQEAVEGERNGYIIDPFDLDRHEQILSALITDKQLLKQKSQGALELVKERFSYESFREKNREMYNDIK